MSKTMKKNQSVKLEGQKIRIPDNRRTPKEWELQDYKDGYKKPSLMRGKEIYEASPRMIKQEV